MAGARIQFDKQKYVKDTLEKLKTLSDYDIKKQLEKIASLTKQDKFPMYPIYQRVKDNNGKMINVEKRFERKDGRTVANTIVSKLFAFLYEEFLVYSQLSDDTLSICETLKCIDSEASIEEKDELLKQLDHKFSFLLEVDMYRSIYVEFRKDYIRLLEKSLRYSYSKAMLDQESKKDASLYLYLPPETYARALQKHRKNKPHNS